MGIDKKKALDTLDALIDALGSSEGQSVDDIKEELRSDGVDVNGALSRLRKAQKDISRAAKRTRLDAAMQKRLSIMKEGHRYIGKFKDWTKEQILERIKVIGGDEVGLAYRDLESMGTEELASTLEDLEFTNANAKKEDNGK